MTQQEVICYIMVNKNEIRRYDSRSSIDLESAIDVIGARMLRDFGICFEQMWQKYNRQIRPIIPLAQPRTIANAYRDMVIEEMRHRVANRPGVIVREVLDRFLLEIDGTLLVQFKKLGPDFSTSNIPTRTSVDFDCQHELPGVTLPRVTVGYQPDQFWTELLGVWLVFNVGKENVWHYNLVTAERSVSMFPLPVEGAAEMEAREKEERLRRQRHKADSNVS